VTPVTPQDLAARARRLYDRSARTWVVHGGAAAELEAPLHPPSEREALQDLDAARAWVRSWRDAEAATPVTVTWEERSWARIGRQSMPVRARLDGAEAVAAVAGRRREWGEWGRRIRELRAAVLGAVGESGGPDPDAADLGVGESGADPAAGVLGVVGERDADPAAADAGVDTGAVAAVDVALQTHARAILGLDPVDLRILASACVWLVRHPVSGLRVRQVPVPGMHTKWLERHRAMVEGIVGAATGAEGLGLVASDDRLRIVIADPALRIAGLRNIAAPITELVDLGFDERLTTVLIVENLETLLALPDAPGLVAIHGSGYTGHRAAALSWVRGRTVLYWGDLDSHGFAILHRVRSSGLDARSVLMDAETLERHRELWVAEPKPFRGVLSSLTPEEQAVLGRLREEGDVRLEQERIGWDHAWARLRGALAER